MPPILYRPSRCCFRGVGLPDFNSGSLKDRSHADYDESSELQGMVRANLVAERIAVETYRQMISLIGDKDPTTRRMLEEILTDEEEQLPVHDPQVHSPRGDMSFSALVEYQRWHAAFHYRQLLAFLEGRGENLTGALSLSSLGDLNLPPEIY